MKRDTGFWSIIALFALVGLAITLSGREFDSGRGGARQQRAAEQLPRHAEIPESTRAFVLWTAKTEAAFLEDRLSRFARKSTSAVFSISLIGFVLLAVRQRRLSDRLVQLESARVAEPAHA